VPLFGLFVPVIALLRLSKRAAWSIKLEWFLLDFIVGHFMRKCDVFIAMRRVIFFPSKPLAHGFPGSEAY
jgi:hypothetical protein